MAAPAKKLEEFSNAEVLQHLQANGLGALCAAFEENEVTGKFRRGAVLPLRGDDPLHLNVVNKGLKNSPTLSAVCCLCQHTPGTYRWLVWEVLGSSRSHLSKPGVTIMKCISN